MERLFFLMKTTSFSQERIKQGVGSVSYTHLDVYKRQEICYGLLDIIRTQETAVTVRVGLSVKERLKFI